MKSWVEISGTKLASNFRAVQAVAGSDVEVLAVIKANAYGHSATMCAPLLQQADARWLGVTDAEEGIAVREALERSEAENASSARILVMCGMEPGDASAIVLHDLTPVVWTSEHIEALERAARRAESRCCVHLEVDSGMSRQGVAPGPELDSVLAMLANSDWLTCEGIMSHLCCSETADAEMTKLQEERFAAALQQARSAGVRPEFVHIGNSSAVDEGSTMPWVRQAAKALHARAMVRTGIALYGYCLPLEYPDGNKHQHIAALRPELQPVLQWKTRVIGIRDVPPAATVGYGASYVASQNTRLALLPVGYADSFRREASSGIGNGWAMIAGQRAPVVGRVSMNLTTVDVTAIDAVHEGAEVTLLGDGVTAEDHARWCGTIPYDILCGVKGRHAVIHEGENV